MKNKTLLCGRIMQVLIFILIIVFSAFGCLGDTPDCPEEADCESLECGPDPVCGESCGTCRDWEECIEGICEGEPDCPDDADCIGMDCGPDPVCNVACGRCEPGYYCVDNFCEIWEGPEFVEIPAGSFWMGSPSGCPAPAGYPGECSSEPGRDNDERLHKVNLSRSFEMSVHPIRQGDWISMMRGINAAYFKDCGDDCPVEEVTWFSALSYTNALSSYHGLPACYTLSGCGGSAAQGTRSGCDVTVEAPDGNPYNCTGYRLPTEAEWEYAARAGTNTAFYTGDITETGYLNVDPNLDRAGWYRANRPESGPQPVGQKEPNAFGLFDMLGNVNEWVWDAYGYYPTASEVTDPHNSADGHRIRRGGSWSDEAELCRASYRNACSVCTRSSNTGFRVIRTL